MKQTKDKKSENKSKECNHDYEFTYQGYDKESYKCKKCNDYYSLYYEDMA